MLKTLEEIREEGFEVLRERLETAGMIRFLQQFSNGEGDYAHERHAWVDTISLEQLRSRVARKPAKRTRRRQ